MSDFIGKTETEEKPIEEKKTIEHEEEGEENANTNPEVDIPCPISFLTLSLIFFFSFFIGRINSNFYPSCSFN